MSFGSWRLTLCTVSTLLFLSVSTLIPLSTAESAVPQVLNLGNGGEPKDLDPHTVTGVPEFHIIMNIFEGLVSKDPKNLEPIPGVAEKWKVSKDGKTYTFFLRKNAKWSQGDPVTASDFIYSWIRLLKPETASEYAYQGFYIKNGKAFNEGKLTDPNQLGLKAIDSSTLEVQLENPTPFFLSLLFHHSLYPVHKATIEKFGARWTRPENFVGNGAFTLKKWEVNRVITVAPNPFYWDKETVKLSEANFFPIDKHETEEKMFRAKSLHTVDDLPLEKLPLWQKDTTGVFKNHPYLGTYYYWFNCTKAPLNNKKVRQALTLAIDRDRIVRLVTRGGQVPATMFTPPGTGGFKPESRLPKDGSQIQKAKQLLAEAGFPNGKGLPSLEILYNTSDNHKKIAEAIQQMWRENLGISSSLFNQEWKVFLDNQQTKNYMIARAGWIADYNDPNTFLDMFVTNGGNNHSGYSNSSYDELIESAKKERNPKKRFAIFQKAEDILLEDLPVLPIYVYSRNYLLSNEVQGWHPNIEDIHPLKYISIVKK
ncbi:MAG: peptide ABC transporter substrate-binding protein [Proteobacteria bacterium]|nr:peptide ABC transporter substrate-binding protein [Pseudomonadota bacterium]NBY18908.1 peptide ABC transporter substrate-binding protein [bacterium]